MLFDMLAPRFSDADVFGRLSELTGNIGTNSDISSTASDSGSATGASNCDLDVVERDSRDKEIQRDDATNSILSVIAGVTGGSRVTQLI